MLTGVADGMACNKLGVKVGAMVCPSKSPPPLAKALCPWLGFTVSYACYHGMTMATDELSKYLCEKSPIPEFSCPLTQATKDADAKAEGRPPRVKSANSKDAITFTKHKNYAMKGHNDRGRVSCGNRDWKSCQEFCKKQCAADYNCNSFEYRLEQPKGKKYCNLSSASKVTHPTAYTKSKKFHYFHKVVPEWNPVDVIQNFKPRCEVCTSDSDCAPNLKCVSHHAKDHCDKSPAQMHGAGKKYCAGKPVLGDMPEDSSSGKLPMCKANCTSDSDCESGLQCHRVGGGLHQFTGCGGASAVPCTYTAKSSSSSNLAQAYETKEVEKCPHEWTVLAEAQKKDPNIFSDKSVGFKKFREQYPEYSNLDSWGLARMYMKYVLERSLAYKSKCSLSTLGTEVTSCEDYCCADNTCKSFTRQGQKCHLFKDNRGARVKGTEKTKGYCLPNPDCELTPWMEGTCGRGSFFRRRPITSCNVKGTKIYTRKVSRIPDPFRNGVACSTNPSDYFKSEECYKSGCPVKNCKVSAWGNWSACSAPCGRTGSQTRSRTITQQAENGGNSCPTLSESRTCSGPACPTPVNCQLSNWSAWSSCSATKCGTKGFQTRSRSIARHARHGGKACPSNSGFSRLVNYYNLKSCSAAPCAFKFRFPRWRWWR